MTRRKTSASSKYTVGYGHPPKHTQFKAGKSGNPKGRPKGSRNVGSVLRDKIQQKIAVTENGRTRRVPALEVMLRRLANDAMRNDPRALKLMLSLVDRYADTPEVAPCIDDVLAEDQAILAQYLETPSTGLSSRSEQSDK
jgi:Family of unknown function (DUF5681)